MTTSGPHGLQAEQAIDEALRLDRHDANRQLWATLAAAHAMLSVSGQLGEILAYLREADGLPPSPAHPAFQPAFAASAVCSPDCVLLPGHGGACIPPGPSPADVLADAIATGRTVIITDDVAPAAPASLADADMGAPLTGDARTDELIRRHGTVEEFIP